MDLKYQNNDLEKIVSNVLIRLNYILSKVAMNNNACNHYKDLDINIQSSETFEKKIPKKR